MAASNPSSSLFMSRVSVFCSLCETRSFSATAKRLGISQSNVSRTVQGLEDELSITLIEHNVRPIKITPAGQILRQLLLREISVLDERLHELRQTNSISLPLRIGIVESISKDLAPYVVDQLRAECSTITVLTGITSYLLTLLDKDSVDFIICPDPISNRNDLTRQFLFREPSIILAPLEAGFSEPLTWHFLKFCGLPLIHYHSANSGARLEQQFLSNIGISFVHQIDVDINALMMAFVSRGMGWALTRPTTLVQHPDFAKKVRVLPMPEPVACRELFVISRKGKLENLSKKVISASVDGVRNVIFPEILKVAPWAEQYLCIADESGERKTIKGTSNQDVFIL